MFVFILAAALSTAAAASPAPAQDNASTSPAIATFTKGMSAQSGLFTLWRKSDKLYVEIAPDQLDTDFIQTVVPANGTGFGITPGLPYLSFPSARIVRFSRVDDKIVVTWPNTALMAASGSAASRAIARSMAPSVIADAPVVAADSGAGGHVVFDASYLLGDTLDLSNALRYTFGTDAVPGSAYRLDPSRTYFGPTKAFPDNVIVQANQTWASASPPLDVDVATDARAMEIDVKYNIARAPAANSYMPRYADDRVGYYPNIRLQFDNDNARERQVRQIVRWNLARHPMTYYLSNTIPERYRAPIRTALLEWNKAFAPIGYPNAVEVKDQPDDPSWDPEDIRYNTVHWLTQPYGNGYAQAGLVWDPRTGEVLHMSIAIDANYVHTYIVRGADFVKPNAFARNPSLGGESAFAAGLAESAKFGLDVLRAQGEVAENALPKHYIDEMLEDVVLHESGHGWGLQHNFIGYAAYTAKQVRSRAFTQKYGLSNSVMAYNPANVWPKGTSTGTYFMTVLGPYDYYAIRWGYAPIPGATTPEAEVPALRKMASAWSNPRYRFAMDEDVHWYDGHAIDPRVGQYVLTDDNVGWCQTQLSLSQTLVKSIETRFRANGESHDGMRQAFRIALGPVYLCTATASHYIAGEELSRAHVGDPGASWPLTPVARERSRRAFSILDQQLFAPNVMPVAPSLLRQLVYSEWVTDLPQPAWAYDPPDRHDVPLANAIEALQRGTLAQMFAPIVLQRLDDFSLKYPAGTTMSLGDLFDWTQRSIYGDLAGGRVGAANEMHRSVQQYYARMLAHMVLSPSVDTPDDAQSLARAKLVELRDEVAHARTHPHLDELTRAHLAALASVVDGALSAHIAVPPPGAGQ